MERELDLHQSLLLTSTDFDRDLFLLQF